jgi:hypothetical protein
LPGEIGLRWQWIPCLQFVVEDEGTDGILHRLMEKRLASERSQS